MSASTWAVASGYASAGLLCLTVAAGRRADDIDRSGTLWAACALVLAVLAVLTLWRLDLMVGDWLRQAIRDAGWYPLRRPLQAAALIFSVWLGWLLLSESLPSGAAWPLVGCVLATALLLFVGWARLLSWHTLDAFMNLRWSGMSLARWLELAGLMAVVCFAVLQWRDPSASP